MFSEKGVAENFQISQENACAGVSFNKVERLRPATLLKRDSNTDVTL